MHYLGEYDYIVIGAGHAGVEAALCGARLGLKVALFTITLDAIANMPCNPSIGGTAKGHLVREIDALGGEMGKAADATFLQSRILNLGKGPAVHSLRVQSDRIKYHTYMKKVCEAQDNLEIKQAEIVSVELDESGAVASVTTKLGTRKYEVYSIEKISVDDTSDLQNTSDNIITLITCVKNQSDYYRWCVKAEAV